MSDVQRTSERPGPSGVSLHSTHVPHHQQPIYPHSIANTAPGNCSQGLRRMEHPRRALGFRRPKARFINLEEFINLARDPTLLLEGLASGTITQASVWSASVWHRL